MYAYSFTSFSTCCLNNYSLVRLPFLLSHFSAIGPVSCLRFRSMFSFCSGDMLFFVWLLLVFFFLFQFFWQELGADNWLVICAPYGHDTCGTVQKARAIQKAYLLAYYAGICSFFFSLFIFFIFISWQSSAFFLLFFKPGIETLERMGDNINIFLFSFFFFSFCISWQSLAFFFFFNQVLKH